MCVVLAMTYMYITFSSVYTILVQTLTSLKRKLCYFNVCMCLALHVSTHPLADRRHKGIISCFEVSVLLRCFLGFPDYSYKLSCVNSYIVDNRCLLNDRKFVDEIVSLYPAQLQFFSSCSASENTKWRYTTTCGLHVNFLPASQGFANQIGV